MELVPGAHRIAALADPHVATPQHLQVLSDAARGHGVEVSVFSARTPEEIVPAMNEAKASGAEGLNGAGDTAVLFQSPPCRGS